MHLVNSIFNRCLDTVHTHCQRAEVHFESLKNTVSIMTIKIKRVLEYNLDGMNSELQFAKIAIMNVLSRLKDVVIQPDFISYHSTEEMEECKRKVEELSNMLQK